MQKHNILVNKTARYFTSGKLNADTKSIWFVLHGYAQTADIFLESLKMLENENTYIVAPEGLSRFYWKDFISNPVASWMTKLDRESDIKDSLAYLHQLYIQITETIDESNVTINFLGFSQGVATLSRWLAEDKVKVNQAVFYAGDIAHEIDISVSKSFKNSKLSFIYGNKDFFMSRKRVDALKNRFQNNNIEMKFYEFEGKHQICIEGMSVVV